MYSSATSTTPITSFSTAPVIESITGTTLTIGSSNPNYGTQASIPRTYYAGGRIKIDSKPLVYQTLQLTLYHECTSASIALDTSDPSLMSSFTQINLVAINSNIQIKSYFAETAATVTGATNCYQYNLYESTGTTAIT